MTDGMLPVCSNLRCLSLLFALVAKFFGEKVNKRPYPRDREDTKPIGPMDCYNQPFHCFQSSNRLEIQAGGALADGITDSRLGCWIKLLEVPTFRTGKNNNNNKNNNNKKRQVKVFEKRSRVKQLVLVRVSLLSDCRHDLPFLAMLKIEIDLLTNSNRDGLKPNQAMSRGVPSRHGMSESATVKIEILLFTNNETNYKTGRTGPRRIFRP